MQWTRFRDGFGDAARGRQGSGDVVMHEMRVGLRSRNVSNRGKSRLHTSLLSVAASMNSGHPTFSRFLSFLFAQKLLWVLFIWTCFLAY